MAVAQALSIVFKSETKALKMLHNLYDQNKYARFIGSAIMPFSRVSFNIVQQMYEYSPLGLLGTVKNILTIKGKGFDADINNIMDSFKLEGLSTKSVQGRHWLSHVW